MTVTQTPEHWFNKATSAMNKADDFARLAGTYARTMEQRERVPELAAVGTLYADIARSCAAIASALPATTDDDGQDGQDTDA